MTEPAIQTTEPTPPPAPSPPEPTFEEVAAKVFGTEPVKTDVEEKTEPEPAPAEKTEETVEEPKADRIGARIAAAKRAEAKAAQDRLALQRQLEEQEKRAADLDAREKRLKLIEDDPVRFFEEYKADPKSFLEKLAGEYKPENVVTRKTEALENELAELKKKLSEREQSEQQKAAKARAESEWKEASAGFIAFVGEQAEKYPHLVEEFTEEQATNIALSVLSEIVAEDAQGRPINRVQQYYAEFGVWPDNEVIAEYLDSIAKQRVEARTKSAWRKRGESADQASKATNGDPKPAPPVNGAKPRQTLTSREASERQTAPKPWSQEAADEESIRILEAALRKG